MKTPCGVTFVLLCSIGCAGGSDAPACAHDSDCASGFCKLDGTCAAAVDADPALDTAPGIDAPPSGACTPDHDGAVTRAELPLIAGRMATFRVASNATFDTTGTAAANNLRHWDLTAQLTGDQDRAVALLAPTGTWWAAKFPDATYATTLAADSTLVGVVRVTDTAVSLLGVVSPEGGSARTELKYDPPATVLQLPVRAGATWSSTSTVSGIAQGIAAFYGETYASTVDQVGTMTTPYGEFPVLRVATDLNRGSGALTQRTFGWLSECFGTVATVSSQHYETRAEFSNPLEVRRLAP